MFFDRFNMIATRYQDRELFAGGVFAAANHVASFCKQVDIVTCLGDVDSHEALIRQSLRPNVGLRAFTRNGAPTTLKRRFVDPSYMGCPAGNADRFCLGAKKLALDDGRKRRCRVSDSRELCQQFGTDPVP